MRACSIYRKLPASRAGLWGVPEVALGLYLESDVIAPMVTTVVKKKGREGEGSMERLEELNGEIKDAGGI